MQFPKFVLRTCRLALPGLFAVVISASWITLGSGPAAAFGQKSDICGSWNNYCRGGSSGSGSSYEPSYDEPYYDPGPTQEQIRAQKADELNSLGLAAKRRGDYEAAIGYYRQALEYDPTNEIIRSNLGKAQNKLGLQAYEREDWDYAAAVRLFEQALQNKPDSEAIRQNLVYARSALEGEQREAERQRQADAEEAESQRQADAEEAESQRQLEQAKQTIGGMLDDLASQWGVPTPSGGSGSLDFASPGGTAVAAASLVFIAPGESLFSKPSKAVPVDVRDLEVATGEAFKQGQDLRDYVQQADWPVQVKSAFVLGVLMAERGRYDEAFDYFLDAAHAAPYDPAQGTPYDPIIRDALQEAMRLKAAKAESAADAGYLAEEVVDPDGLSHLPLKARAGVMVAAASVSVGDYDAAVRILGEAAEAAPGDEGIRDALVYVRQLKAARDERAAGPPDPELLDAVRVRAKGNAAWGLGLYLAEKGDYDGAVHYLNEARPAFPGVVERDILDKAIANVRDLGGEIPGFPAYRSKADAILDALEYGKGDWDASLRYLEVAHDADPNNLDVRDALNYLQGLSAAAQFAESQ